MGKNIPLATAQLVEPEIDLMSPPRNGGIALQSQQSYKLKEADIVALKQQGFTRGLAQTLTKNNAVFPLRIWVVDNSGSMNIRDGHRLVETTNNNKVKLVECTRWAEIQQTVDYHSQLAALTKAPTTFRLLNDPGRIAGPQHFSIADDENDISRDLAVALQTMRNATPSGLTPLTEHLHAIRNDIAAMEATLRANGTKVAVILATDGLPTNIMGMCNDFTKRQFMEALRSLEGLPCWVVIRLCTDDEDVVQFYNDLDAQLEISLEVIDDFVQEAQEVYEHNSWLNYALPLHRCREMGYHNRLFDLLDERQLSPDELRSFLFLLFGADKFDGVPDPQADFKGFLKRITPIVNEEKMQWNPVTKKMAPWVDMKKLKKEYKNTRRGGWRRI